MGSDFDEREVLEACRILAWIACHPMDIVQQRLTRTKSTDIVHWAGGKRWCLEIDSGTGATALTGVRGVSNETLDHPLPEDAPAHLQAVERLMGPRYV